MASKSTTATKTDALKKGARITGTDRKQLADELTKKYTAGTSIRALAEETSRSYGFIHRVLTENGVTLRARGSGGRAEAAAAKASPAA